MLDKLLDVIVWVDTAFTRTRDPVIEEYRGYQRQLIVSGSLATFGMLAAWFVMPAREASNAFQQFAQTFAEYVALASLGLTAICCLWFAWSAYCLWRFLGDQ